MEKQLTNSGPLREPADKHSIYPSNQSHSAQLESGVRRKAPAPFGRGERL